MAGATGSPTRTEGKWPDILDQLEALSIESSEAQIVARGVEIAEQATDSGITYLHFLNEDQNTLELGIWSVATRQICHSVYDRHYPIESAGIWADSARTQTPCLHNDYASLARVRGLPEGHVKLVRHLGVPVVDAGRVTMLIGVGNKATDYEQHDIDILSRVARRIWAVIRQRRLLERYIGLEQRIRHLQEVGAFLGFEYDIDEDALWLDDGFEAIFGLGVAPPCPTRLSVLLERIAPDDRTRVAEALTQASHVRRSLRTRMLRTSMETFPGELKVEFRPREIGQGTIAVGVLQDLSDIAQMEDLRLRVDCDPLTGLPNRNRFKALFEHGLGRRGEHDTTAFHFIDLDDFKPVNDGHGHLVGDEVLRIVAQRLVATVRKSDVVIRLGGDEFVVLQTGIEDEDAARILAGKLLAAIREPILALGVTAQVGASIGVAIMADDEPLDALYRRADTAMYAAKSGGGHTFVLSPAHAAAAREDRVISPPEPDMA